MLHSVGCPQPNAETFVKKWNNPESSRACVHAFIDGKTGKVYQTLPWEHKAWHCGGNANSTHIGVELILPSEEYAKKLLKEDLAEYAASVNHCVKKGLISFPLSQNQFDALTSFCYNCGAGKLQRLVTGSTAAEVAEKIPAYNKGGGKALEGIVKRREEEKMLFLS